MKPTEKTTCREDCIHPVILKVPEKERLPRGREQVMHLRRFARRALELSALKSHAGPGPFLKDSDGVPLPSKGFFWSLSHKPDWVGAVVAPQPTGIDIETIKDVSGAMCRKIAGESEWGLIHAVSPIVFFRYWTAKEAVLKAAGVGMKGLSDCRIRRIADDEHLEVDYQGRRFSIEQIYFNGHIASVVQNGFRVDWTIEEAQNFSPESI